MFCLFIAVLTPSSTLVDAQITGGQVYYNCTVNGFLPYNTVDDLCTDQEDGPDPCPLGVGHHTVSLALNV